MILRIGLIQISINIQRNQSTQADRPALNPGGAVSAESFLNQSREKALRYAMMNPRPF